MSGIDFGGIIYAHQTSITIGQCITDLEVIAACCTPEEIANQVVFLPL